MTSYFSEEKYCGELIRWSASNGVFEAIVRARHHQQVSQPGGELIMDQTSRYLSFLLQVSFSPGYSGLLSRSIRQIKVGSNWDEREKIFRYPSSPTLEHCIQPKYKFQTIHFPGDGFSTKFTFWSKVKNIRHQKREILYFIPPQPSLCSKLMTRKHLQELSGSILAQFSTASLAGVRPDWRSGEAQDIGPHSV